MIAGTDEAGVGSLCHIMTASAVVFPNECKMDMSALKDSKKLTEKKRAKLYEELCQHVHYGIGVVTHEEIDELGMARCRRLVFHRALDELCEKTMFDKIIVDGTLFDKYKDIEHECMIKADDKVLQVSAASVIAKHYRDVKMYELCEQNPKLAEIYGWKSNKGYPSKHHRDAIVKSGISKYHRTSYGPCKNKKFVEP